MDMLTLDNGSVSMFTAAGSDNMTVRVKSGFYITQVYPTPAGPVPPAPISSVKLLRDNPV